MEKWGQSREQQRAAREMTREAQAREKMEREIREWNEGEQRGRDVAEDFSMEAFASQQAAQAKAKVAQLEEDMGRMEARLMTLEQQLSQDIPAIEDIEEQTSGDDTKLDTTGSVQSSYDGPFAVTQRQPDILEVEQGYIWAGVNGFFNWPHFHHTQVTMKGAQTGWYGVELVLDHGIRGPYYAGQDLFQVSSDGPAPFDEPYLRTVKQADFPIMISYGDGTARLLAAFHWDNTLEMITHLQQRQFGDIYLYVWAVWAPPATSNQIIEPGNDVAWLYSLRPVIHRPNNDPTQNFPDPTSTNPTTGGSEDPDQREHS